MKQFFFGAILLIGSVPLYAQVGIGTTTPQYPLDVNGRIRIQYHNRSQQGAGLWFNKPDNTVGTFIGQTDGGHFGVAANASGNWNFVFDHQHTRLGIGTLTPNHPLSFASTLGDKISLWSADPLSSTAPHYGLGIQGHQLQLFAPTATDNIVFGIGSSADFTEQVRITGNGKVGIGTDNPTSLLTVKSGDLFSGIGLDHTNFDGSIRVGTHAGGYIQTHSDHPLLFATNNNDFQAVLTTSGIFGIGTSINPVLAGLVVNRKVGAVNAIFGSNLTGVAIESNFPGVAFNSYYNNGRRAIAPGFGGLIGQDPGNGRVYIYSSPASIGAANADMPIVERLSILPNGNVGVGNTNPQAKLDVAGNVKIVDGTQGAGKVLTSDAAGNATWQNGQTSEYGAAAFTITPTDGYYQTPVYDLRNSATPLLAGVDQLDEHNRYNTGNYVVGVAGSYSIRGSLAAILGNSTSYSLRFNVHVYLNGTPIRSSTQGNETLILSNGSTVQKYSYPAILNTLIRCNAGDVISLRLSADQFFTSQSLLQYGQVRDGQFTITKL